MTLKSFIKTQFGSPQQAREGYLEGLVANFNALTEWKELKLYASDRLATESNPFYKSVTIYVSSRRINPEIKEFSPVTVNIQTGTWAELAEGVQSLLDEFVRKACVTQAEPDTFFNLTEMSMMSAIKKINLHCQSEEQSLTPL